MIALNDIFVILEDKLHKCSVVSLQHRCVKVYATASGPVRNASHTENARDFEVVGELKRSVRSNVRHAINCVSLFAIHYTWWTRQYDGPGCVYETVMVGALRVGPRPTCCQVGPDGAGLIQRPINLDGGSTRGWAWNWACRVAIAKNSSGGENCGGKSSGDHNVVVLSRLIRGYQNRVRLAHVDIKGWVRSLKGVCSFNFHQFQFVVLYAKVKGIFQPHIWYPKPVGLSCWVIIIR